MAWAMLFDGVNDYGTFADVNIPASTPFVIEFGFAFSTSSIGRPFGRNAFNNFNSRCLLFSNTQEVRLVDGSGVSAQFTAPAYNRSDYNTFRFERDINNDLTFHLNGALGGTVLGWSGAMLFNQTGRHATSAYTSQGGLSFFNVDNNSVIDRRYSGEDSDHGPGTPLMVSDTDIIRYITGRNMPTDGTAWLDLGGGGTPVTAAGDITLPSLVFSGSATDTTSEVTAAGDITLPSLVFSGSATDTTSEVTAAGDITLPSLVFSGSATDTTSEVTAAGDITLPSLVFSGSATDTTSEVTAAGDITLPSLVFSGSATNTQPAGLVTATGDITLPSLVFSGSATDTTSEVTATGDITLPSLVFSGSATDTTSEVTATGDITLPSLVFSGSATDTTSEVTATGDITLPSLVFSGSATAGEVGPSEFTIIIDVSTKTIQTTLNHFTIEV